MLFGDWVDHFGGYHIGRRMYGLAVGIAFAFLSVCTARSDAAEFTATTLGDYGNVTVMEVTGNYDADNPDGTTNAGPRQAIAKEFYRLHKDEYDFLVIFTNFDFTMPEPEAVAFYTGVKNDTQGIGKPIFDKSAFYGSNGKLQGTIDMGSISNLAMDPLDPHFEHTLDTLSHEMMHRWAAYARFRNPDGSLNTGLLGREGSHWSFLLSTDASLMYGNTWQDNGDGTFTSVKGRKYYSPLDLYLMGFIDRAQVPAMLLIDNPDIDPKRVSELGVTIQGTSRHISIDDIIAAEGERIPAPGDSQKSFRAAFIYITDPGTFTGDELYGLENIRSGWLKRYSVLTDGAGIVQVAPAPIIPQPINPGVTPPVISPRSLPSNIHDAVLWLINSQKTDGNWMDLEQTTVRDTAAVVNVLGEFDNAGQNLTSGLQWLGEASVAGIDYLARQLEALANAGKDTTALINNLVLLQNKDGGWGSTQDMASSPSETALVLKALVTSGYKEQYVISRAIDYLKTKQGPDNGWGHEAGSRVGTTASVLTVFNEYKEIYQLNDRIASAIVWLLQHQNPDGGFGNSPSTIYDTALATLALAGLGAAKDSRNNALEYLKRSQSGDDSWNESSYQTALAVKAIYGATLEPDLSVRNTDISFVPATITSYPSTVVINSTISNLGSTPVPSANVVLYADAIAPENRLDERSFLFPGLSSISMAFQVPLSDAREHTYYIVVDPGNLIKESDETNNVAFNKLESAINYDFEILPADLTFSRNPVDITTDVKITARISNRGRYNAYNVHVKYYIDELGLPFDIGTSTVDIPAGATVTNEITWKANKSGTDLPVAVYIDPLKEFDEVTQANNKALALLTVKGSTDPNLTALYKDISINPPLVNEGANAAISAVIMNTGYSAASNIVVNFYLGNPGAGGVLLGTQTIPSLNAGETTSVAVNWNNINAPGTKIIYVKVDPDGLIKETTKDDNDAFVSIEVLSLPDLAISANSISFNPAAPRDGDTVSINVMIKNLGEQTATNVPVRIYDGSNLIDSQTLPSIGGNSQATVAFSFDTAGKSGAHQMTVKVDPDNTIIERSKDNNTASKIFGVQDANLWLTEPYISPNGDSIKDSTQFFFGLQVPQTVKIQIVNEKGEAVRTYAGADLENISGGNITWDGLNDNGSVVADGQYQLKVVATNGNSIGSLLVTVDNDRSPLSKAIGTEYLLDNNLSCMLPDINPIWLPNESGLIFPIYDTNPGTPEYPAGIYTMAPDGDDIMRFPTPADWFNDSQTSEFISPQLSPDGERIAFARWKYDAMTNTTIDELWVVGSDGNGLALLGNWNAAIRSYGSSIEYMVWAPDSRHVAFTKTCQAGEGCDRALWVVDVTDSSKKQIDISPSYLSGVTWAQDSNSVAYTVRGDGALVDLRVSDRTGRVVTLATMDYLRYPGIHWIGSRKMVISEYIDRGYNSVRPEEYTLSLYDAGGSGEPVLLSDKANDWVVSPDGNNIVFVEYTDEKTNVKRIDEAGNISLLYDGALVISSLEEGYRGNIDGLSWSRDGRKIAFIHRGYKEIDRCIYEPAVVAVDIASNTYTLQKPNGSHYLFLAPPGGTSECADRTQYSFRDLWAVGWLSDSDSFVLTNNREYFVLNTTTGERSDLPGWIDFIRSISPMGRYIDYYDRVWQGSSCYGRGNTDLWAISSLLNLTADLRVSKNRSSVVLKGTAADLNFEGYRIEYAEAKNLTVWNLVQPPSNEPVNNDEFTRWVPPYEGTFSVRLTVWDKAGNIATDRKRVSWGLSSSIANIYKSTGVFSPNNDGVKDTVSLNYTVLEPVHLEFNVYDSQGISQKKFYRDHVAPGADKIIWDGTDDSGRIVPDGEYVIKVFDYEFFVEVDNTPPDANLALSKIRQSIDSISFPEALGVDVTGHAYDKNLMSWVVEYGEGDNPQAWYESIRGRALIGARDESGDYILDPIGDAVIQRYENQQIPFLTGKRFRITVEDTAGNKSSAITAALEEKVLLYFHSWGGSSSQNHEYFNVFGGGIYAALGVPEAHSFEGLETLRVPLSSVNIQYWSDLQWHDAARADDYSDGGIFVNWDRSLISEDIGAVRIKAVDIDGYEHYSNAVSTKSLFYIEPCVLATAAARNFLFEKLTRLRLQIKSSQDPRYSEWTDYSVLHGPNIPIGEFSLAPFPDLQPDAAYRFRMIGIDENGNEHTGDELDGSCGMPSPKLKMELEVDYAAEAGCGLLSDGRVYLYSKLIPTGDPISRKSLSYYLQTSGGLQLLRTFDLARETWGAVDIDTSTMPEGIYPVQATLTYSSAASGADSELSAGAALIVDRVQPEAKVTYPGKSVTLCPLLKTDSGGAWPGIPIEGIAQDNSSVRQYEVYYGFGEAPDTWEPARTRIITPKGIELVPITGRRTKGKLGDWYVEDIHGAVNIRLKVVDIAGNATCDTITFGVKDRIDVSGLTVDKPIFSPNGDGVLDTVTADFRIDEYVTVDVKVFSLIKGPDGKLIPSATAVKTLAAGVEHFGGTESIAWDGTDDSGGVVADGMYGLVVFAADTCGNKDSRFVSVEVDNTPPVAQISCPGPSDPIGTIVEIKGTANDANLAGYILEASSANSPDVWLSISGQIAAVNDGILGTWNTFGLDGPWTLRLTANDRAGNSAVTMATINLGTRKTLVRNLAALPKLFSPNNDGKLDTADISYELTDACSVSMQLIDAGGVVLRNYETSIPSAGQYSYGWNGKSDLGTTVPEGIYTIKFFATSASNASVSQTEVITIASDTASPLIDIKQPLDQFYTPSQDVMVNGTISDLNLAEYSIVLSGDSGIIPADSGNINRVNHTFSVLDGLSEGMYTLNVMAKDYAENLSEKNIAFTIDRTVPKVTLSSPRDGEIYGNTKHSINISGGIVERNLESYAVRYGSGDNPSVWTTLTGGNTVPQIPGLFDWKVGGTDNIPDGLYVLTLSAKDKAGLAGEARVKVIIDNTRPEVSFASPLEGGYIKAPMDIKGTGSDANLQKYTLELADGLCASAYKWAPLKVSATPVKDGVLGQLRIVPPDGNYCLRLTAADKVDNSSETKINIMIDTVPPAAPVLEGKIEGRSNSRLTWQPNTESDLAGYDLYRDGTKLNIALIHDTQYLDQNIQEGIYSYTVRARDLAGNESISSGEVKLKIDLTGPAVRIHSPRDGSTVSGIIDIKGTAYSSDDFQEYRIHKGKGSMPDAWHLIRKSPVPTPYGTLAQWDTLGIPEGTIYSIRLEAEDLNGNISTHITGVVIDNTPPAPPVLVSAIPTLSDVALAWRPNSEQDLTGYLLYRNDQLANAGGTVVGNLKPYLMTGTAYPDMALPDGKYKYYLIAMDQAGNTGDQSNVLEVSIDTHPPHLTIVSPSDKSKFDKMVAVRAESPDNDIASVQFQYKQAQDEIWINLGAVLSKQPYVINLDPLTLGLAFGDFEVRAVSADTNGNIDPSPSSITLTYMDITPPGAIRDLKASVNGNDVTLSWSADSDADLDGYNIYRTEGSVRTKLTMAPVKDAFYHDDSLADGNYAYEVTASDKTGNETQPSNRVFSRIYAPVISQPYSPVGSASIQLTGGNAIPGASVEIFLDRGAGPVSQGMATADATEQFIFGATLGPGPNKFTAKATDAAGNISRMSDMAAIIFSPRPAAPTGLTALVSNHDVALTWNANTEADLAGYNLYRDGVKLGSSEMVAPVTGSATVNASTVGNAFDQDPTTCWISDYGYYGNNPVTFEIGLSSPELINGLDIQWLDAMHAAFVYEIQAWSGYAWITVNSMYNPWLPANHVEITPSYRTDKLRINIARSTDYHQQSNPIGISEIAVNRENLLTGISYNDPGLQDGNYIYTLTAVNYNGFESQPSPEAKAAVGDVTPPAVPGNLAAAASGDNVSLSWTANTETDLAGYNLYRLTPDGWVKLNNLLLTVNTYADAGLPYGTYTYRVTAVDVAGNEGQASNEASAVVIMPGTNDLLKPTIFFPTVSGVPVISASGKTDISGSASPDAIVALYRDGSKVGETRASVTDATQTYTMDANAYGEHVSPDGKLIVYTLNDALLLQDMNTGAAKQVSQNAYGAGWSPQGNSFAYYSYDSSGNYHVGIYDILTGATTTLTDDVATDEPSLTWAPDGRSIAFSSNRGGSYNIWLKDLKSGSLTQVTNAGDVFTLKFSPDGNRLAYFVDSSLFIHSRENGTATLVDSQTDTYSVDWSPDGSAVVYISYRDGNGDIYTFNAGDQVVQQITHRGMPDMFQPFWTPDGRILFALWDGSLYSLGLVPLNGPGQIAIFRDNLWLNYFDRIKSGAIAYKDNNILNLLYLKGHFVFTDIALSNGVNQFVAVASDSMGSPAQLSDEISVTFDASVLPDLEITTDDIYLYPLVPVAGQQLGMNLVVWNRGPIKAEDVEVDVYLSDAGGNIDLLKTAIIAAIDPGAAEVVSIPWDTAGKVGLNTVTAVLDPQGHIAERVKDNNYAVKDFFVVANEGISMTTTLHINQLKTKEDLHIDTILVNSGIQKAGTLEVFIEDNSGHLVSHMASNDVQLPYGYQGHTKLIWNPGITYAGQYRVHSVLHDRSGALAEHIVPFIVLPDISAGTALVTDKSSYEPNETVSLSCSIQNTGDNYIIPAATMKMNITDAKNVTVFSEIREIGRMFPGSTVLTSTSWNIGMNIPGMYTASVEIFLDEQMVSAASAVFMVQPVPMISGSIQITPHTVVPGNQVVADYAITNKGNSEAPAMGLKVLVIDPETRAVMNSYEKTVHAAVNETVFGQTLFSTQGYGLKTYMMLLQTENRGSTRTVASASFVVRDGVAPSVSIHTPVSGSHHNTQFDLSVTATDSASGVDSVQYQVDRGGWRLLPAAGSSSARYATSWVPVISDEGIHIINFRASDKAGNVSEPVSTSITIDLTPPSLTVSTLSADSRTNNTILNVAGSLADNSGLQSLLVNGIDVALSADGTFSHPFVLEDGPNIISVIGRDLAGNETTDTRTIYLDRYAPLVTIIAPADNIKTGFSPVELTGTVDEASTVEVSINGASGVPAQLNGNTFLLPLIPAYGINTIEVIATDLAGNVSAAKRTLIFDDKGPSLAVIVPSQDLRTNQNTMLLQGGSMDLTAVAVTITVDRNLFTPAVMEGRFEQTVTFIAEKVYQIYITATDEVGNETTVQRNIIFDTTAPSVTIDPVVTPSNQNSQMLTGTREAGSVVSVLCSTAGVGMLEYPTSSTWAVLLTGLHEGDNTIMVTASDECGNTSPQERVIIQVDTLPPPPPVIVSPADGAVVSISTVDISGKAEPGAFIQMVSDPQLSIRADLLSGDFVFRQFTLAGGRNSFAFFAKDAAGNSSEQTRYTLTVSSGEPSITGTISAKPAVAYQGNDIILAYSLVNTGQSDISGLTMRVVVSDTRVHEIKRIFETLASVPASTTRTGIFSLPAKELAPDIYRVDLEILSPEGIQHVLASATFYVKPGPEITKTVPVVNNLLVWINAGCDSSDDSSKEGVPRSLSSDTEQPTCRAIGLLERILEMTVDSYYLVYNVGDFQSELRNPFYTDIMILGDMGVLKGQFREELREKVHGGTGLIASLWTKHGVVPYEKSSQMLGITHKGKLAENHLNIRTVTSPVSDTGIIAPGEGAERVETMAGTTVAGWFEQRECLSRLKNNEAEENDERSECDDEERLEMRSLFPSPAIVLTPYGSGRTVYFAFDLIAALMSNSGDRGHDHLSSLIIKALAYVHTPAAPVFRPGALVPVELKFRSFGPAFDLQVSQTYPSSLKLLDPAVPAWVSVNPWTTPLHVNPLETKQLRYYVLIPDKAGIFTIKTDAGLLYQRRSAADNILLTDFVVELDLKGGAAAVLALLQGMSSSNDPAVAMALTYIRNVHAGVVLSRQDIAQNISDLLRAIAWVGRADGDFTDIRLLLDELLRGWESRYYFEY